jgi:RNA polymerase sigma-70 factor (ECF subfamily)
LIDSQPVRHVREGDDDPPDFEAAWIEASRADPRAFAPLYERYAGPIYRYCYRMVSDPDVANDLTAQTFIKAIERIDRFHHRGGASFKAWLFAIARNTITDRWRRHRPVQLPDAVSESLVDQDAGPEYRAVHGDELTRLLDVLDELPDSQRAIIELRIAGLTTNEICVVLDMTLPAVKSAQSRAYKRLRTLLSPPEGSSS